MRLIALLPVLQGILLSLRNSRYLLTSVLAPQESTSTHEDDPAMCGPAEGIASALRRRLQLALCHPLKVFSIFSLRSAAAGAINQGCRHTVANFYINVSGRRIQFL